jgi:hypothetical protein
MGDLIIGFAIVGALTVLCFAFGVWAGRRPSRPGAVALAVAGLGLIVLHATVLIDRPLLARLLPVSNLAVVGNLSPLGAGVLAGFLWGHRVLPAWRRLLVASLMLALTFTHGYGWMLGRPPECGNWWTHDGVCRQTSESSCSAAAAATMLRAYGIPATEEEMARLCLTRSTGTTFLGLYRGLKLKTKGTAFDVDAFNWTLDDLRSKPAGPVLLHVRLDPGTTTDPRYERDWGWTVGRGHAVVFFRFKDNGLVEMGDPDIGRERWGLDSLDLLWHGTGLRLVPR